MAGDNRGVMAPDEALAAARAAREAAERATDAEEQALWLVVAVRHYTDLDDLLVAGADAPREWTAALRTGVLA